MRAGVVAAVVVVVSACGGGGPDRLPASSTSNPPGNPAAPTSPNPPRNVRATAIPRGAVLQWDPPIANGAPEPSGYFIRISPEAREATLQQGGVSATIVGLQDGATYSFAVRAESPAGSSEWAESNAVTIRTEWPTRAAWRQGPSFTADFPHSAFVLGGVLYLVGANDVYSAPLEGDGRPTSWTLAGRRNQAGEGGSSGVAVYSADGRSGYLYLTGGGQSYFGNPGDVWVARIPGDGTVGPFLRTGGKIGPGPKYHSSAVHGRHLYVAGGTWWSGGSFTGIGTELPFVQVSDIADDGTLGSWRRTAMLPRPGSWRVAVLGDRLYALSAHGDGTEVVYTDLLPDGSVAGWKRATAQLGRPYGAFALAAEAGHLYVLGGERPYGEYTNSVAVSQLGTDGDVMTWEVSDADAFNGPRSRAQVASGGGRLYLIGGGDPVYASVKSGGTFFDLQWATIDPATGHLAPVPPRARPAPPGAPSRVQAIAVDAGASVSWSPPVDDGGAPVIAYGVSAKAVDPSGPTPVIHAEVDGRSTAATLSGLNNGVKYTFEVRARNATGAGPSSGPTADAVPSASPTWRAVPGVGVNLFDPRTLLLAGDVLFLLGNTREAAVPLDPDGIPWGQLGPGYRGSNPSHWNSWAQAVRIVGDRTACAYRIGGRDWPAAETDSVGRTRYDCLRGDGFLGETVASGEVKTLLPTTRMNGAAAAVGEFLYVLGGTHVEGGRARDLEDVSVAAFLEDGDIGPWRSLTPLPGPDASPAIAARGKDLYLVAPPSSPGSLLRATSRPDGTLSGWGRSGPTVPGSGPAKVALLGDALYVFRGGSVLVGRIDPASGDPGSWQTESQADYPAQPADFATAPGRLYLWSGTDLSVARVDPATGGLLRWR